MVDANGEQLATAILGAMPPLLAEKVLGKMGPVADRLRPAIATAPKSPELLDAALVEYFDVLRILERGYMATPAPAAEGKSNSPGVPAPLQVDPLEELKKLKPDRLLRALEGEPSSAVAHVLTCLDAATASLVMKGLPAEVRAEVALRYSQPGPRNFALLNAIAKVVAEKGNALTDQPETKSTDRVADLATMFRGLPRAERVALLQKVEASEPALAKNLKLKLFRFTDLLKVEDRPLQQMLSQLNLKIIASAIRGVETELSEKILRNISARARDQMSEEVEMLGNLTPTKIQEAQDEVVSLMRQFEEEGKITLED
jgi:flagellar motor switch protein FliG